MTQENQTRDVGEGLTKCPKCGNVTKQNFNVCTKCGTRIKNEEGIVLHGKKKNSGQISNSLGIGVGGLTVIAAVVLFNVSAILGMILYFIGFGIAIIAFKEDERVAKRDFVGLAKHCFKKQNLLSKGILLIVVALVPIVVCVGIHRWLFADTMREVDYIYNQFGGY